MTPGLEPRVSGTCWAPTHQALRACPVPQRVPSPGGPQAAGWGEGRSHVGVPSGQHPASLGSTSRHPLSRPPVLALGLPHFPAAPLSPSKSPPCFPASAVAAAVSPARPRAGSQRGPCRAGLHPRPHPPRPPPSGLHAVINLALFTVWPALKATLPTEMAGAPAASSVSPADG